MTDLIHARTEFGRLYDKRVHIHEDTIEIRRTWRERLFSWPWRPRQTHKWVNNPVIKHGECYMYDDIMIMRRSTFNEVKQRLDEAC